MAKILTAMDPALRVGLLGSRFSHNARFVYPIVYPSGFVRPRSIGKIGMKPLRH